MVRHALTSPEQLGAHVAQDFVAANGLTLWLTAHGWLGFQF